MIQYLKCSLNIKEMHIIDSKNKTIRVSSYQNQIKRRYRYKSIAGVTVVCLSNYFSPQKTISFSRFPREYPSNISFILSDGRCTYRLGDDAHGLRVLVCEEGEQGGEGAQAGREEDEEGQLLLRVHRHFVEG